MAQNEFSTGTILLFVLRSHGTTTFTDVQPFKVPCEQSENRDLKIPGRGATTGTAL